MYQFVLSKLIIFQFSGSGLFATLDNAFLPECSDHLISASRFRLWASILQALPPTSHQRCWGDKMSLNWDVPEQCKRRPTKYSWWGPHSFLSSWLPNFWPFNYKLPIDSLLNDCEPTYTPIPGVNVDVDSPGLTRGFDYLDYVEGLGVYGTKYFHDLIVALKLAGYVEGDTLIGHPFDWRYPVWQLNFKQLKDVIEDFTNRHPDKKLTIIAHSLGKQI